MIQEIWRFWKAFKNWLVKYEVVYSALPITLNLQPVNHPTNMAINTRIYLHITVYKEANKPKGVYAQIAHKQYFLYENSV